jgi:hypothetical protein
VGTDFLRRQAARIGTACNVCTYALASCDGSQRPLTLMPAAATVPDHF